MCFKGDRGLGRGADGVVDTGNAVTNTNLAPTESVVVEVAKQPELVGHEVRLSTGATCVILVRKK